MLARAFPRVYEGWFVVGSTAFVIVMIGAFFFYGLGTIFNPVKEEFGWSSAAMSVAFSLRSEVQGFGAPVVGYLVDRLGPRRVLMSGIALTAGGLFGMSFMQNLWQFYLAMVVIATGISAAGGPVGLVAIATWFERRRGRAMGLMTLGGGLSGLLLPLVGVIVTALGWRDALRVMSMLIISLGLLAALNVRSRPERHHQPLDGIALAEGEEEAEQVYWGVPIRRVLRSRSFLLVALGQSAMMFAITAIIVHQIPFLEDRGVSSAQAALAGGMFPIASLIGRLGFGLLADRYDKRLMLTGASALAAAGMPLLAVVQNFWQAVLVLLIIAPGFGGMVPVRPALLVDYFGTKTFGTVNGLSQLIMTIGAFGGPVIVGIAVDQTGRYTLGWLGCAAVAALAVPLMFFARPPTALIDQYRREAVVLPAGAAPPALTDH